MADSIKSTDVPSVHGIVALNPDGTAIGTPVGGATSDNQTNGTQKTQIVDAGGEAVTVTGGKLDVNATASLAGTTLPISGATDGVGVAILDGSGNQITSFGGGTQYTEGDTDASITGTVAMVEGAANAIAAMTQPLTDTQLRATAVPVSGTFWQATQPVSASSLPLPSGAATEAKQPALGTAGTPSTDVITVQGATSMTALKVDGSAVTQPVSGTFWQATQPVSLASVPSHEVTNAGTFVVQENGGSLTALQLIDDVVTAQGTSLGSTKTVLQGGSVTTAAPTYTTGQINPLSLATTGALRVDIGATSANGTAVKVNVASGGIASGAIASGAIASGAIAAGAVAAGATAIAANEDDASAGGDRLLKVSQIRLDTPVANANVSASGDYTQFIADNLGKTWTADCQTEDAVHATGDRGSFVLAVRTDSAAASSGTTGDYEALHTDANGKLWVNAEVTAALPAGTNTIGAVKSVPSDIDINGSNANHADKYYTNTGAVTDGIVWSPAAGKRWHILTLYINVSAAATVTLEDNLAGGDVVRWKGELAANSGVVLTYDKEHPFCSGEDAADLIITTSAGNVYVQAVGYEI